MQSLQRLACAVLVLALLAPTLATAQPVDIPLTNWTVPPYRQEGASSGLRTMADVTPGVGFVGVQPCRIVDTRGGGVFTGAYGPPALVGNTSRNFDLNSAPHCPGIPDGVAAYSLNFTVTDTGAIGDLRAWPQDNPPAQVTSVLNWTAPSTIIANAIIVPAGTGGGVTVTAAGTGANVLIDVNGYFTSIYNPGVQFVATGAMGAGAMIVGMNSAAVGDSTGVWGHTTGLARTYGVLGTTLSNPDGSAGVKGVHGIPSPSVLTSQPPAGVLGASPTFDGVLGIAQTPSGGAGVRGIRMSGPPFAVTILSSGELGAETSLGGRFVNDVDINGDLFVLDDGVHGPGDIEADGMKMFVEPHPTDASKLIKYVALEGPEAGTYFRGRARFQNGIARIAVPEDFRAVTSAEGLTVQITPIGGMATYGVLRLGLDEVVVQGSRNVEFSYLVQGVRRAFADFEPIQDAGVRYVRAGAGSRLGTGRPQEIRRRLIGNGTYNADGTVNMETALRLGWDRVWAEREAEEKPAAQR